MCYLKKFVLIPVVATTLITSASLASAAAIEGAYIALDLGRSSFKNGCGSVSSPYKNCKNYDFSHRTTLGYQIDWSNAAELSYFSSGQFSKNGIGNNADTLNSVEWQLSGLKYFQVGPPGMHFSVFGRLGISHWELAEAIFSNPRTDASGNSVLFGIGTMHEFSPATAARIQYEFHKAGNNTTSWQGNISFLSFGINYQF
jgi:hypothetical protein